MTNHIDLTLIGFGSVARPFVDLLVHRATPLGLQWRNVAVATAHHDCALAPTGLDAAAKIAVLANVLLGAEITPHDVAREGLRALDPPAVQAARQTGGTVKLVASAERRGNGVVATVGPRALDAGDPLAGLSGTAKGLIIETDVLGKLVITKPVPDVTHTAYALMADFLSIHY